MTTHTAPRTLAADPARRAAEVARFPLLPTEKRFGITVLETGSGTVHARQRLPVQTAATGAYLLGVVGPMVDFAVGRATQSILSPTVGIRTTSLRIDLLGASEYPGDAVEARAEIVHVDQHSVYGEVYLRTAAGAPLARASARMLIVEGTIGPTDPEDPANPPAPAATLAELLDTRMVRTSAGGVHLTAPAAAWMVNPWGIAHGGIPVALAGLAIERAARSVGNVRTIDFSLTFHRPITLGDQTIHALGQLDRPGKSVLAASAVLFQTDANRPAATATATLLRA